MRALWLVLAACGCNAVDGESPAPPRASPPEPMLPSPSGSAASEAPSWQGLLPAATPTARAGDLVWAASPVGRTDMVDVAIYNVDGVYDGTYSLTGRTGQRIDGVHPALVHRADAPLRLADGDIVLFYTPTTPAYFGRVREPVPGEPIRVQFDRAGTTAESEADHVQAPVIGIAPLAYVAFPKSGAMSRGLVIAATQAQIWIRTASGHVEVHDRGRVEAISLPPNSLAVNDGVRAFRWATGYQNGAVTEVLEPGLRYKVKVASGREDSYFFSALVNLR